MSFINRFIGVPLGYGMWLCYELTHSFGLSILLFTLLIKLLMLPLSFWVQRNSIKMIKIKPALNRVEARFFGDRDRVAEEQLALYKQENYKPMAGVIPMLIQIPLILGIMSVVYNPLQHILHLDAGLISAFSDQAIQMLGAEQAGSYTQLRIVQLLADPTNASLFSALPVDGAAQAVIAIQSMNMSFLGLDLTLIPDLAVPSVLWLVPILSGFSAFFLSWCQNKLNVLQKEASWLGRWGVAIFLTLFSLYFTMVVPVGVGVYWIAGNLIGILVLLLCNAVYPPKKYIDYPALEESKQALQKAKAHGRKHELTHEQKQRSKADYKRFIDPENKKQLVFYSEKSGFYKYYKRVIDALIKDDPTVCIHYVTSDPNDGVFKQNEPRIQPYFVDDNRLIPLFMQVDSDVMVMTVPDLQNFHLKRSYVRKDVFYVYMVHGILTSMRVLRKGALDHYDAVLSPGKYLDEEIRTLEQASGAKEKELVPCGYGVIEDMAEHAQQLLPRDPAAKKRLLIAPSWQPDNILESCLTEILSLLHDKGYEIVIRPHPQYLVRNPQRMAEIMDECEPYLGEDCRFEMDFSSNETVYTADVLMTDWSGIGYEYALSVLRPVLFINTPMKVVNSELGEILTETPVDVKLRPLVGKALELDSLQDTLAPAMNELTRDAASYADKLRQIRSEYIYNFGESGERGAAYLLSHLKKQTDERKSYADRVQ